jgi:transcriptional regulator with XRE-family HTH domain
MIGNISNGQHWILFIEFYVLNFTFCVVLIVKSTYGNVRVIEGRGNAMTEFGELLKTSRKEKRISQRKLGELAGIDFTYISKIENGTQAPPSEEVIRKIAEVLEIDTYKFILSANKIPSDYQESILINKDVDELHMLFRKIKNPNNLNGEKWKKIIQVLEGSEEEL